MLMAFAQALAAVSVAKVRRRGKRQKYSSPISMHIMQACDVSLLPVQSFTKEHQATLLNSLPLRTQHSKSTPHRIHEVTIRALKRFTYALRKRHPCTAFICLSNWFRSLSNNCGSCGYHSVVDTICGCVQTRQFVCIASHQTVSAAKAKLEILLVGKSPALLWCCVYLHGARSVLATSALFFTSVGNLSMHCELGATALGKGTRQGRS